MGRKRTKDKHLPKRWKLDRGKYYYIVPPGHEDKWDGKRWFPLGDNLPDAYRRFADRVEINDSASTMNDLFDRYLLEHTPTCRPKTQAHHHRAIKYLRSVFGHVNPASFESNWAYKYYDERKRSGKHAADTDLKVLSHVFSMAIKWGALKNHEHPLRGLKIREKSKPNDRYVEDWEISELVKVADDFMKLYIAFKLMTGMDKSTILSIQKDHINEVGIQARRLKTKGKVKTYKWTPELKYCVKRILLLPSTQHSEWLFCTEKGTPLINEDGYTWTFDSRWKRLMSNALENTNLQHRFKEHDLRAKAGSDVETLQQAQSLLDHSSPSITDRVYRRRRVVETRTIDLNILGLGEN